LFCFVIAAAVLVVPVVGIVVELRLRGDRSDDRTPVDQTATAGLWSATMTQRETDRELAQNDFANPLADGDANGPDMIDSDE
jgi:hypothetical protein